MKYNIDIILLTMLKCIHFRYRNPNPKFTQSPDFFVISCHPHSFLLSCIYLNRSCTTQINSHTHKTPLNNFEIHLARCKLRNSEIALASRAAPISNPMSSPAAHSVAGTGGWRRRRIGSIRRRSRGWSARNTSRRTCRG